jgi:hypothetical protein
MVLYNDEHTGGLMTTKDGPVTFSIEGNEVTMHESKSTHRLNGQSLDEMTFEYLYNPANNKAFEKWNPGQVDSGIFHVNEKNGLIGIYLELIDRKNPERNYAMEIYRKDVGSLMEVLFIMASLGDNLCDVYENSYKFATLIGVSDIMEHYAEMIQHPHREPSLNWLMYVAGKVRGYCENRAENAAQMAEIINEVTLKTY